MERYIYRIESIKSWTSISHPKGSGLIVGELSSEGFIHCSNRETLLLPANKYYRGRADLVVLEIDAMKVDAEIRYEDLKGSGIAYPHVFGEISINAVRRVIAFPCDDNGIFSFPSSL